MNRKLTQSSRRIAGAFLLALALLVTGSAADIISPLYIGNNIPALDEYGVPLTGSNDQRQQNLRCLVELRMVLDGQIHAPDPDTGEAHENNPLVCSDAVGGMGQNASASDSGIFCMIFPTRLPAGLRLFARAYNDRQARKATFYCDSSIVMVPSYLTSLVITFGEAQPMDPRDIDADGLANSWEASMGTDGRFTPDFDGDGVSDLEEMLAGTGATDASSLLAIRSIVPEGSSEVRMAGDGAPRKARMGFASVAGKRYQVECVTNLVGPQECIPLSDVITATGDETEIVVELPDEPAFCTLRVRLVVE